METKVKSSNGDKDNKKRKQRYLPHNKPVKKGSYPLRPGLQGFFITCDGGRERQASMEAINVIDSFFEELVQGKESDANQVELPAKPLNKKIKFTYSDSDEDESSVHLKDEGDREKLASNQSDNTNHEDLPSSNERFVSSENQEIDDERQPAKKQCLETDPSKHEKVVSRMVEKSIDKLIEAELEELKDKSKRRFSYLDSGCNGVVFVQMRKVDGDPSPKDIVQHMLTSAASTRKHISRYILRVLPVEVTCYASEEEISRAIKPLIEQYFPAASQTPYKFAVLYEARANTGVERIKIIDAVAKSVSEPHKVDLSNPDRSIVVQIARTVCSIGVVEKYKELAKYNLRQLTSSK